MKYTEAVYKRKRRGKVIYDGVLTLRIPVDREHPFRSIVSTDSGPS